MMNYEHRKSEEEYQYLKGKHEGIKLALGILNRRDVHPTSIRWLTKERGVIESVPIEGLSLLVHKREYTRNNKARNIVKGDFLIRKFILRDENKVKLSHHPIYNPRNVKTYLLMEREE